jgi:chromate transporter
LAPPRETTAPSLGGLFLGFLSVGLRGFGGVLPWARRMIVEERGWLSDAECTGLIGLCQVLPGPNIVNLSVALGSRFHGVAGAAAAFCGLLLGPLVLVLGLAVLAARYGDLPVLQRPLGNLGAAASGLVWAAGFKMAGAHWRNPRSMLIVAAAFAAVALVRWPLVPVVLGLAPLSLMLHQAGRP